MLDELQYYVDWYKSGAMKMLVRTTMEGYLGTHVCYSCSNMFVNSKIVRIAHFKCRVYNASYTKSDYLSMYSDDYKREIDLMK